MLKRSGLILGVLALLFVSSGLQAEEKDAKLMTYVSPTAGEILREFGIKFTPEGNLEGMAEQSDLEEIELNDDEGGTNPTLQISVFGGREGSSKEIFLIFRILSADGMEQILTFRRKPGMAKFSSDYGRSLLTFEATKGVSK